MKNKFFVEDNIGYVELLEVFGDDLTVVNAARVSFSKESHMEPIPDQEGGGVVAYKLNERDKKLIRYLASHDHITPFFHPQLRFRIKMPIFVAREWYRHVIGFARNEVSRRYVFDDPQMFVPNILRKRDENIKQGSSKEPVEDNTTLVKQMSDYCKESLAYYKELLDKGVCPEQARMILPQSMYTEFVETASLAAYARLVNLRLHPTAQKEIQDYAKLIEQLVLNDFPVSWQALMHAREENKNDK